METYQLGDLVRVSVAFTNLAGAATDPTTITLNYVDPAGTTSSKTYAAAEVVKDSTGNYHYDITANDGGTWTYQWVGTGAVQQTEEDVFYVLHSALEADPDPSYSESDVAATPAAHKIPRAAVNGKIDAEWLPDESVIRVSEDPPVRFVSTTGDDSFDGRWDRPKETLQAAVEDAPGGRMLMAPGTHTSGIVVTTGVNLQGTVIEGAGQHSQGVGGTVIKPQAAAPIVSVVGSSGVRHGRMTWRDLTLDGDSSGGSPQATSGFHLGYAEAWKFDNVAVINCDGHAWDCDPAVGTRNGIEWYHCEASDNLGSGIYGPTSGLDNNWVIFGGLYDNNSEYGMYWGGVNNKAFGAWITSNHLFGVQDNGTANCLHQCLIENNWTSIGTWAATTAYVLGDRRERIGGGSTDDVFTCTVAGTSAGVEPTWSTAPDMGDTLTDGTVTWQNVGQKLVSTWGAGVDDTGSSRLVVIAEDLIHQGPLGTGNTIWQYPTSSNGGHWHTLTSNSVGGGGMLSGMTMFGNAGRAHLEVSDDRRTNVSMHLVPKGTGGVAFASSSTSPAIYVGTGDPNSVVTGRIGSLFQRTDGGASTSLYVKESGTGNTGWVAK